MEKFHCDYRSKTDMLKDEIQLRIEIGRLAKLVEELVGRMHFVRAKAELIQAARFIPLSKVSKAARAAIHDIIKATEVHNGSAPKQIQDAPPA